MFEDIYNKIKQYDKIIIHRHNKPDGDALGSQMGLKECLISTFPDKDVKIVGDENERLNWLGKMDEVSDDEFNRALCIIVDSGSEHLISDTRYKNADCVIKIDHHIPQGEYGDISYVDTSSESCASIIAELAFECGLNMNTKAASYLFTGIVTDSGRFRYSQTNSRTFNIVSKLMNYNIDTNYISRISKESKF